MAINDYALVVGISKYLKLGDLNGPENDARDFYEWVRSPQGGAVPEDPAKEFPDSHIKLILSSHYPNPNKVSDAQPAVEDVQKALLGLDDLANANADNGNGLRVGRRLYLYFAGHGFAPLPAESALLMANATRQRVGFHIPGTMWANWFFRAGYFDEIVLFMDCCRESYPRAPLNVPPLLDITDPDAVDRVKRFFGFGTKWSRLSRERAMADGKIHGVFTTALLEGLKGKASNETGQITAASLGGWLFDNMKNFLSQEDRGNADIPQEPDLDYDNDGGKNFVLVDVPVPTFPVNITVSSPALGKKVAVLDNTFAPVAVEEHAPAVWKLSLKRGTYLAQVVGNGLQKVVEVSGTGEVNEQL